jgi:hypothetical protein
MTTTFQEIKFWLEYRKGNSYTKDSFTNEASMTAELKKLIKSGIKPKIVDLSKTKLATT